MKKQLLLSILLTSGIAAFAAPVTPTFTSVGSIPGATWGGTGNPDTDVTITSFTDGSGNTVTLGLQAQQRYGNDPVQYVGNGTYAALTGQNNGFLGSTHQGSTWNFDFYFDSTGGNYTYKLLYGTDAATLLTINPALVSDNGATPNHGGQNSQNLLFPDFGGVNNGLVFNPLATGVYSFELEALLDGRVVNSVAINVDITSAPDATSTATLMGLGIAGIAAFGYRKNRLALAK
jgi:hypothetical protein